MISGLLSNEPFYPLSLFKTAKYAELNSVHFFSADSLPSLSKMESLFTISLEDLVKGCYPVASQLKYLFSFKEEKHLPCFPLKLEKPVNYVISVWNRIDIRNFGDLGVMGFRNEKDYGEFGGRKELGENTKWRCYRGIWYALKDFDSYRGENAMGEI